MTRDDLQRRTFALLQQEYEPLDRFERARLWARIDGARRQQRKPWMGWAALAMSCLAAVLLVLRLNRGAPEIADPARPIAERVWIELSPGAVMELGRGRLTAETRVILSMPPTPQAGDLWIADGAIHLDMLRATEPRTVITRAGRLQVFASESRIWIGGDRVELVVDRGRIELEPDQGEKRTAIVGAREQLAPAAVEEAAPPSRPARRLAPKREDSIETLMRTADLHRRAGRLDEAEREYARAASHPRAAPFLEEALVRRASILAELGRTAEAIDLLARARARFDRGELGPERTALEARLRLSRGGATEAAAIIERWDGGDHHVIDLVRLDVARELIERDPERAKSLLLPLIDREGELGRAAQRLLELRAR